MSSGHAPLVLPHRQSGSHVLPVHHLFYEDGQMKDYNDGKTYVLGGGCGALTTYASPSVQQTALLTQPQVAKYSIMFDTDSDVFPNSWLLNGVDNSIGARWRVKYRSMTNPSAAIQCAASGTMSTWGQETGNNCWTYVPYGYHEWIPCQ